MTGFEITMLSHYGPVAGLHIVQMLSSGTMAYSIDTQNNGYGQGICTSGPASVYGRSSSTHQPTAAIPWDHVEVVSASLSGTSEGALCAAVPVDIDADTAPTATWYPYIGQDGTYELLFFTPACAFDATCGQRGAVDVEVVISSNAGTTRTTTTINQEVDYDLSTLVYSGTINPIADDAQVRVTMKLSGSLRPTLAPGKGDKYYLVADKIITIAKDTDGNGSSQIKIGTGMNSVNVSTTTRTRSNLNYVVGHGLFQWSPSDTTTSNSPTLDAALSIPQNILSVQSASAIDRLAFGLSDNARVEQIIALQDSNSFVLAGAFAGSLPDATIRNIMLIDADGTVDMRSQQLGLNGPVTSVTLNEGFIYAAGNFTSTTDGTITGLAGLARRQIGSNWEALSGLSSTANASYIGLLPDEQILIAYRNQAADFWFPANSSAAVGNKPLMLGDFTSSVLSANGEAAYIAGPLTTLLKSSSSGSARITKGGLQPLNFAIQSLQGLSASTSNSSLVERSPLSSSMMASLRNRLRKRQSGNTLTAPSVLPPDVLASSREPIVYAGAYWRNVTSDEEVTILGGRFGSQDGELANLGILHSDGPIASLRDAVSDRSDVKALLVNNDLLWIGRAGSENSAVSVYDLSAQQWRTTELLPVNAFSSSGTQPSANAIIATSDRIIIAGYFESLNGMVGCSGVCEWNRDTKQWTAYGSGVEGVAAAAGVTQVSCRGRIHSRPLMHFPSFSDALVPRWHLRI